MIIRPSFIFVRRWIWRWRVMRRRMRRKISILTSIIISISLTISIISFPIISFSSVVIWGRVWIRIRRWITIVMIWRGIRWRLIRSGSRTT
jgi:hypothetical protein